VPGVCDKCGGTSFTRRDDDRPEVFSKRLAKYQAETAPLLPYYRARGLVRAIDGMADVDVVSRQLDAVLAREQAK
jgi:adenylate kinase